MALGWLKVGTGLALAVIAGFVMIHPDRDLLEGLFQREKKMDQVLTSAILVVSDGPSVVSATAPLDAIPVLTVLRPDSLDLSCVRLC
jgi:hypothetical protein